MTKLWVKRTNSSSYFPPDFTNLEGLALQSIEGIQYLGLDEEIPETGDLCLITNTHSSLAQWQALQPRVKLILHPNSGLDNLAPELGHWQNTPVVLGNPIRAQAVCEWTLAALMQHFTPLLHHSVWPASRHWERPLLKTQRVLILGAGHVGGLVQQTLQAMGLTVAVHDPYLEMEQDLRAGWDVVIVLASLNPANQQMLNAEFFQTAPPHLLLINPARGEFVDENALRDFLKRCPRARAYLDVHAVEPYPVGYWDDCPQVIATPHTAGVWDELIASMIKFEVEILSAWQHLSSADFLKHYASIMVSSRWSDQGWYR